MLLDYAHPQTQVIRRGLALAAAVATVAFGVVTIWCAWHSVRVVYMVQHNPGPFFCAEGAEQWAASLGLPLEQTIPIGVLSGGVTLVSFVQSLRCVNGMRE